MDFSKNWKIFFLVFSKSTPTDIRDLFFEIFLNLEISAKANAAFWILAQNKKVIENLWKIHFFKKKSSKKISKSKNDLYFP